MQEVSFEGREGLMGKPRDKQRWPVGVLNRIGVTLPGMVSPMKVAWAIFTRTKRS